MKNITVITFIYLMATVPTFAESLKNEVEYKKEWCAKYNGEVDYKTQDKTTADCITDTHAIEFENGKNWNAAIRKSRQQSMRLGKTPGVVLILENSKDVKYLHKLREINEKRRLGIKIWTVGIDVELPCDIKGDIDNDGDKIYHFPGQNMYDATVVNPKFGETWFCSYEEAEEAGWKPFQKAKPINHYELGGIRSPEY